ncbi:I66 family serine proteinase inhibitor [Streptomyces sp. BF23-19]|uniref:I66 family serine proteinase inhibitor n=1 Tax=Streptomyces TaxID=1883 RepID=UPI0034E60C7A|nr:I66 family serine proteinase inhibitor [Streptomyces virginiae]
MSTKQLHIDGKPVAAENGTLVVGGSAEGARWQIERQPQHGQNAYTITRDGSNEGWVAPDGAGRPITVRPLITTKSLPPHHPNNQLWQISPLDQGGHSITSLANELSAGVGGPDSSGSQPIVLGNGGTSSVVITNA